MKVKTGECLGGERQHEKMYHLTCAPNKYSDQSVHPPQSDQSSLYARRNFASLAISNAPMAHSDQIVQICTNLSLRWAYMAKGTLQFRYKYRYTYLRGIDTLSGKTTLSRWFCLPSEKGSTLKGKNLLPMGANSFLLE